MSVGAGGGDGMLNESVVVLGVSVPGYLLGYGSGFSSSSDIESRTDSSVSLVVSSE